MNKLFSSSLRLLLVVLFSTFMSPNFAWQMIDSHSEVSHTSASANDAHQENDIFHHHHVDGDEEDTAHSQIGHLLSHMPAVVYIMVSLPDVQASSTTYPICSQVLPHLAIKPPFKPPRVLPFV